MPLETVVLRALGVDLDQARLFLGVVAADDLDRAAIAAVARVGDSDAVLGVPDLAEPGKLDLRQPWLSDFSCG